MRVLARQFVTVFGYVVLTDKCLDKVSESLIKRVKNTTRSSKPYGLEGVPLSQVNDGTIISA